jgi:cytochrome c556
MRRFLTIVSSALVVAACSSGSSSSSSTPPTPAGQQLAAYQPVVTLNEIMVNIVDPHAHELWDAATPAKEPKTDEDWRNIRHAAVILAAAGSLTTMSGNGPKDQVWREQKDWAKLSQAISDAGREAVLAVQNRNTAAISKAGDDLLQACLNCHKEYKLQTPQISADPQLHTGEF